MFLKLSSQIEGQLREAYAKKYAAGILNQSTLAGKLGVDRSAINRRLTGRVNMTEETIADMVWGLEYDIDVKIFNPSESQMNQRPSLTVTVPAQAPANPAQQVSKPANLAPGTVMILDPSVPVVA
jgi:hypothetical protein